jgi:hypothetical protein
MGKAMTIKQFIGCIMITIVLACTILGVLGVWGIIEAEDGWTYFNTLIIVAIGLGVASGMIDTFFKDGAATREVINMALGKKDKEEK